MLTPPPPSDTPSDPSSHELPPPPGEDSHVNDVLERRNKFSWKTFGGDGFLISVAFHVILAVLATFYVVSRYQAPKKPDTADAFSTGAGGGNEGDKAKEYRHKLQTKQIRQMKTPSRIVSKSASSIALPETPSMSSASFASGLTSGGMSSGSGGGSGGGRGTGIGIGVGNGKNFVGRFLGSKITAKHVAVYMDASGSMSAFLGRVESEAKTYFPEADVFRYNGIYVIAEDGNIVWGSSGKKAYKHRAPSDGAVNDPKNFSDVGKKFLSKADEDMKKGSVGAWFDHVITEKYDAVIIFSDFQDGFVQYNKAGNIVFKQKPDESNDARASNEKVWENRWMRILAKAKDGGAPRVYCYSIDAEPQDVWKRCADVSGGGVSMVKWMRSKNGKPPEGEGLDAAVRQVDKSKGRTDTPAKPR